jgi:hypothetical protein
MKIVLPVERSFINVSQDVDYGDILIHTTYVLVLGRTTDDETGEEIGVGRILGINVGGIQTMKELLKELPDLEVEDES